MKILIACEYSAIVWDAFRARGHDAWSCDLLPTDGCDRWHVQGNVLEILNNNGWDMMIGHPPCTYLANSGVRWLYDKDGKSNLQRIAGMIRGADFFKRLLSADISKICVENPIPHKHAELPKYSQIVQPWMFGDNESKAICLWLKDLPKLVPDITEKPDNLKQRVWRMAPGPDRQKERSRFFLGTAKAMASQWG